MRCASPTSTAAISGTASTTSRVTRWIPRGRGRRATVRWSHTAAILARAERGRRVRPRRDAGATKRSARAWPRRGTAGAAFTRRNAATPSRRSASPPSPRPGRRAAALRRGGPLRPAERTDQGRNAPRHAVDLHAGGEAGAHREDRRPGLDAQDDVHRGPPSRRRRRSGAGLEDPEALRRASLGARAWSALLRTTTGPLRPWSGPDRRSPEGTTG